MISSITIINTPASPCRSRHFARPFAFQRTDSRRRRPWLPSLADERRGQCHEQAAGYRQFTDLDEAEVALIEPLRALRMIHHSAWIAARWNDPAFPRAFHWFTSPRYWQEHLSDLWQQLEAVAAPPMAPP